MPRQKIHKMTQEQYAASAREFGFLAVVHFWRNLLANRPPENFDEGTLQRQGYAYIQRIGLMIADEVEGQPVSPHLADALRYCGLYIQKEWLQ